MVIVVVHQNVNKKVYLKPRTHLSGLLFFYEHGPMTAGLFLIYYFVALEFC